MTIRGTLALRDRTFGVKKAEVVLREGLWRVVIETESEEIDDEDWSPHLYHQGLRLSAKTVAELPGESASWAASSGSEYPHPELGFMYVFGHHPVRDSLLTFRRLDAGQIELTWEGLCDVFWDDEFSEDVPFLCECSAEARAV